MAASFEADWQRARSWLKNEKVTRNSAKVRLSCCLCLVLFVFVCICLSLFVFVCSFWPQVPDLSNIKTEAELYTYLKDGTELCRMIGIVTKGTVLEKITYR